MRTIPAVRMPAVIQFLGYNPEPEPEPVGARLRWKRRSLGWTIYEAARRNSVDPSTWETWEKRIEWPVYPKFRFLREFMDAPAYQLAAATRRVRDAGEGRRRRPDGQDTAGLARTVAPPNLEASAKGPGEPCLVSLAQSQQHGTQRGL